MPKTVTLHLAKLPQGDLEALAETLIAMARSITGKDPTPEDIAEGRKTLGLPVRRPRQIPADSR